MYSCKLGFAATWHTCTLTSCLKQWWLMTLGTSLISGYTFGMLFLWRQDWCDYCNNWVFALITVSNKLPPPFNRKSNPPLQSNICCQMEAHRVAKAVISFDSYCWYVVSPTLNFSGFYAIPKNIVTLLTPIFQHLMNWMKALTLWRQALVSFLIIDNISPVIIEGFTNFILLMIQFRDLDAWEDKEA